MTSIFRTGAAYCALAMLTISWPAAAAADQLRFDLKQSVDYAVRHNPELRAVYEELGIRDAALVRAGLYPNPVFDLELESGALTGNSDESKVSIGLSQEFLLADKRGKRSRLAGQEREMFKQQIADKERLLVEGVKTALLDTLLAQQRVFLADRAIDINRQLLDVTKERLAAGDIPELEMNLVKVELARSEGARIDAIRALSRDRSRLWTLMGLPAGVAPEIVGSLDTDVTISTALADMQRRARENRPDLRALEAEIRKGEADLALAGAEGIPNLTAGLTATRDRSSVEVGGMEGKDTAYTIGVKLSMPIPVFDRNQAGVQEARARHNSAQGRLAAAIAAVEREVETVYAGYRNTESVLSLYKTTIIPQLEENLKLSQEAYQLGEVAILTVIQEQKKFFEVNEGYLTALHDRLIAVVRLESVTAMELTGGVQ